MFHPTNKKLLLEKPLNQSSNHLILGAPPIYSTHEESPLTIFLSLNLSPSQNPVLFHHPAKQVKSDLAKRELDLQRLKEQHEIQDAE